jgi:ribosomal-protein-alanine N-acetyltransferase
MVRIETDKCIIRSYEKSDIPRVQELLNNKEILQNMSSTMQYPYTLEAATSWVEHVISSIPNDTNFVIEKDGKLIGAVGFDIGEGSKENTASGGYWITKDYWGQGIGTVAWKTVRDYAFMNTDIRRLSAGVYSWNPASARILEKCGFSLEGTLRQETSRFDKIGDDSKYGILRGEWEKIHEKDQ